MGFFHVTWSLFNEKKVIFKYLLHKISSQEFFH